MEGGQYDSSRVFLYAGGGSNLLLGLALALVVVSSAYAGSWTTFMGHDTVAVPPKLSVAESDSYFVAVQADIYGVTETNVSSSPAVGDFYPDSAGYEVIAGCAADNDGDGRVYAWESDGEVIESGSEWWPQKTIGGVQSCPALANIDSSASSPDSVLDVIEGSDGGYVYAFKFNGDDLANFPFPARAAVTSSPAIADVDGDGHLELVVGCQDGYVFVWFLEGSDCASYAAPWPMFKHDYQRTAWMDHTP